LLHEILRRIKRMLQGGAACLLALLLCGAACAEAAGVKTEALSSARMLVPVGHTVGVKLFAKGVMVVKFPEGGTPAKTCGLQTGDVIVQCAGNTVVSAEQFQLLIQKSGGSETELLVKRAGNSVNISVEPTQNEQGVYCIGAWIRDSMAGIGTMTYYDPATGDFGALGHGITDVDTAQLMPFGGGSILPSKVKTVRPGEAGTAGELKGEFDLNGDLGELRANTDCGVFGTLEIIPDGFVSENALPVGTAVKGPAKILANVQGDQVREYDIEIAEVISDAADGRDMMILITDAELKSITGGIVQGMSGSPILQNGKIVGAVTHVLVNDPTRGYGIFIENMLEAAG